MKISACSIVKNEANNIARSIESYKDAVDEIIIVDTGSTDNTVELCKEMGAKVLLFQWCNDFAAAKNYALDHASGNWILFLDADEWFVPKLKKSQLINIINKVDFSQDGILTTMCDLEENNKIRLRGVTNRIFRGSPEIRFHGKIHEKLLRNEKKLALNRRQDVEIFHSGYVQGMAKFKAERNITLLYDVYNKGEIDTELYFYLFRENCYLKNIDEAVKFYNLFFEQQDADEIIKDKDAVICIFETMYRAMLEYPDKFKQSDIDRIIEMAYERYPKLPIHSYMVGAEMLKKGNFVESFKYISQAIAINLEYLEPYTNKFFGYLADAYYKLGYIRQNQGFDEDALSYYIYAIKIAGGQELVLLLPKIIKIIESQPEDEIILFLNSVLNTNEKGKIECILEALKKTRLHRVFIYYALKYNQQFDEQDDTTYIAMILTGQAELAVETAIAAFENVNNSDANGKWHLDYAVVGLLYSKRSDLFLEHKDNFNIDIQLIIEAFLENKKVSIITDNIKQQIEKIKKICYYILPEDDLLKLTNIIT